MHFLLIDGGLHFRIFLDQNPEQAHQVHQKVTQSLQMPHPGGTLGSKAKLSLVATLDFSSDPYIRELLPFLEDSQAVDHLSIPRFSYSNLDAACKSVPKSTVKLKAQRMLQKQHLELGMQRLNHSRSKTSLQRHCSVGTRILNLAGTTTLCMLSFTFQN